MEAPSTTELTSRLLALLPLLNRIVAEDVRREAGDETTLAQFRVLSHLHGGPLTVSTLARRRRVSLQAMGEVVQSLVERGWVERTPSPTDRRQSLLRLTPTGNEQYQQAFQRTLTHLEPIIARLTDDELCAVSTALTALHRVLTGEEDAPIGY